MSTETLTVLFISSLLTVIAGVVSWLLKDYLKGVKTQLAEQNVSMKQLLDSFGDFKLKLVEINGTLDNIKEKQSNAHDNIKEAKKMAYNNQERLSRQRHDINSVKNNVDGYHRAVVDLNEKVDEMEKYYIVLKSKEK